MTSNRDRPFNPGRPSNPGCHGEEAYQIHQQFLTIAPTLSTTLTRVLNHNGPLTLVPDQTTPFPQRLCRTIAGQQLSVKAAQSIWNRVLIHVGNQPLIDYFAKTEANEMNP